MWLAEVDTRHFHFEGIGQTKQEAETRLRRALRLHAIQYSIGDTERWIRTEAEGMQVRLLMTGSYRDRERLDR